MSKLNPEKLKRYSAYAALSLLFTGWAAFVLLLVNVYVPAPAEESTAGNLEAKRAAAIEEAKRQGKKEYSFTTTKIPAPLSP